MSKKSSKTFGLCGVCLKHYSNGEYTLKQNKETKEGIILCNECENNNPEIVKRFKNK